MTSLSGYWGAAVARAMEGADKATRLALALGPIRSIVRVVDDSPAPMTVNWARSFVGLNGPFATSRTNVTQRIIEINPMPVIDSWMPRGVSTATALDVTTAFALHESGHAKHSRDATKILLEIDKDGRMVPRFKPLRLAGWLLNLLRDVRDEALVAAEWPGFEAYFPIALDWVWENEIVNAEKPDVGSLAERCNIALAAVRFPKQARAFVLSGQATEMDLEFWAKWRDGYTAGTLTELEAIETGLAWLSLTRQARTDYNRMIHSEAIDRDSERIERQLARLLAEGMPKAWPTCVMAPEPGDGISDGDWTRVQALLRDELIVILVPIGHGDRPPVVTMMLKPHISGWRPRIPPPSLAERLRSILTFRGEQPAAAIKLQRDGRFDDTEIHRWAEGDYRLFTWDEIEAKPDVAMGLLMDLSGSMNGPMPGDVNTTKYEVAIDLATAFVIAATGVEGVEPRVWGHSTGDIGPVDCAVYRFWEPGDPIERISMAAEINRRGNYDGYAIAACVQQLALSERRQKVLFVLSDGIPSGLGYGGEDAMRHVRAVVDWAAAQGVTVIQIAIDTELRPAEQAAMFRHWVGFKGYDHLPRDLGHLMERFLA